MKLIIPVLSFTIMNLRRLMLSGASDWLTWFQLLIFISIKLFTVLTWKVCCLWGLSLLVLTASQWKLFITTSTNFSFANMFYPQEFWDLIFFILWLFPNMAYFSPHFFLPSWGQLNVISQEWPSKPLQSEPKNAPYRSPTTKNIITMGGNVAIWIPT